MFDVNSKITPAMQIFEISLSESRIYKKWQTSGEMVQNLESPGLSGRVDSNDNFMARSFLRLTLW